MSFASTIITLRTQKGLSQVELAQAIGVSVTTISLWERGKMGIKADALEKLADFFEISVDSILGRDVPAVDQNIQSIQRAYNEMDPSKREDLMSVLKISFNDYFK